MKKLLLAVTALIISAASVNAQKASMANPTVFSIGVEGSAPSGTFHSLGYNFGIGGSAQVDHRVGDNMDLNLNAGYITYANKSSVTTFHFNVIPVLAGVRYWVSPKVYLQGQLGAAFNSVSYSGSSNTSSTGFAYSPGIGFSITQGIDLLVKYFGNSVSGGTFSSFGGRLAYTFGK